MQVEPSLHGIESTLANGPLANLCMCRRCGTRTLHLPLRDAWPTEPWLKQLFLKGKQPTDLARRNSLAVLLTCGFESNKSFVLYLCGSNGYLNYVVAVDG